uniref:Endonuclease/exonuclease/phosphatase domain-containing protein n=1 Tax=Rhodnius prolixus TaxID=13249 RepID=T1H890_RHOPR
MGTVLEQDSILQVTELTKDALQKISEMHKSMYGVNHVKFVKMYSYFVKHIQAYGCSLLHKRYCSLKKGNNENNSCNGVAVGKDVYELVSAYCHRPLCTTKDLPKKDFRIATWNLTDMCREKAENNAIREVFCLTILENSYVMNSKFLCVNESTNGKVPEGGSNLGFMYNAQLLRHVLVKVVQDNSMMHAAEANITFCGSTLNVLNIHLLSNSCESSFTTLTENVNPTIILGDFSLLKNCDKSAPASYKPLFSPSTSTKSTSFVKQFCYDNIYFKETSLNQYAGESGIVRNGLCHLAIPKGWNWNGPVLNQGILQHQKNNHFFGVRKSSNGITPVKTQFPACSSILDQKSSSNVDFSVFDILAST